jgi:hypothetical protein
MMDWWTYRLSDFALFSPRVYYRLIELHNQALWPLQIVALALGLLVLVLLAKRPSVARRIVPAVLAAAWLWVGWSFFWRSYATINWASPYMAPAAALQAGLLIWLATLRGSIDFTRASGGMRLAALALFGGSVLLYPLAAIGVEGRSWRSAELFGIAPDPTALATLAAAALAAGRARWAISIVPALWCAVSGATLWAIGADAAWLPPLGAMLALSLAAGGGRHA